MDIIYRVEWWERDNLIGNVCDVCGEEINVYPCAVLLTEEGRNPHALCPSCTLTHDLRRGDDEYFESFDYHAGLEKPKPGVNFGGRKKEA